MKIRRDVKQQPVDTILSTVAGILEACGGNASATPFATEITALTTAHTGLSNARASQMAIQQQAQAATDATSAAVGVLGTAFEALAARVENAATMTPETAHGLGFEIYQPGAAGPIGALPPPSNLHGSLGDHEQTIDLVWDRLRGARSYIIHKTTTPTEAASWQLALNAVKSSCTVTGLTTGIKYWFRVAALGAAGQSDC